MPIKQLTKRNYLGEGYVHQFRHAQTGEIKLVPCDQAEYESLATGAKPESVGWIWEGSTGGTIKVDTPNEVLGLDEYCDTPFGQAIRLNNKKGIEPEVIVPARTVVKDKVDTARIDAQGNQDQQ